MSIEEEIGVALDSAFPMSRESAIDAIMPMVRKAQAEVLRKVAAQMDEFIGTILNPAGCAAIARAEAERIEKALEGGSR